MRTTTRFGNIVLVLTLALALGAIAPLAHASPDSGTATGPPSASAVAGQPDGSPLQLSAAGQGNDTTPDTVPGDWWSRVQEDIRRSEYHVTWQDFTCLDDVPAAYQAPNRAQNLRTYFTESNTVRTASLL